MGILVSAAAEPALEPKFDSGPYLTLSDENDFVVGKDRW